MEKEQEKNEELEQTEAEAVIDEGTRDTEEETVAEDAQAAAAEDAAEDAQAAVAEDAAEDKAATVAEDAQAASKEATAETAETEPEVDWDARKEKEAKMEQEARAAIRRPGGELSSRPLHFFWVVDCSGSMFGEKIGTVNNAIQEVIPEMRSAAEDNPNAQLLVRTLRFATGAAWKSNEPVKVEEFVWEDLEAEGFTDLGKAFALLHDELTIPPMSERALPPVIVLLSDGQPTDDYKKDLAALLSLPWAKKAVRIAISIGQDADDKVLEEFTGNRELVLQANNAASLTRMIKWASTVAAVVSAPASSPDLGNRAGEKAKGPVILNLAALPPDAEDEHSIKEDDVW